MDKRDVRRGLEAPRPIALRRGQRKRRRRAAPMEPMEMSVAMSVVTMVTGYFPAGHARPGLPVRPLASALGGVFVPRAVRCAGPQTVASRRASRGSSMTSARIVRHPASPARRGRGYHKDEKARGARSVKTRTELGKKRFPLINTSHLSSLGIN